MSTTINFTRNLSNGTYDIQIDYLSKKIKDDLGLGSKIIMNGADCSITFQDLESGLESDVEDIIEASRGQLLPQHRERKDIISSIYLKVKKAEESGYESGYEQESGLPSLYEQMFNGISNGAILIVSLDSHNYIEARKFIGWLLQQGIIGQYLYDLVDAEIPSDLISK